MAIAVGCVPFLNARPLVSSFETAGDSSPVEVRYDWPSRLPGRLESGELAAVLVSSIEALSHPGRRVVEGCAVATRGEVRSVRLFSRVPLSEVGTLALDASSMTSNALARIVLREVFGADPTVTLCDPDGEAMLGQADACVLIGDRGLTFDQPGLHTLDLGRAWRDLTGLPFVWALWVGGDGLTADLSRILVEAAEEGARGIAAAIASADLPPGIDERRAHAYLTETFDYGWGPDQARGLEEFGRRLVAHGLLEAAHRPQFVSPAFPAIA